MRGSLDVSANVTIGGGDIQIDGYLKESSLGSTFMWHSGYVDVSVDSGSGLLADLLDVSIGGIIPDGSALVYDSSLSKWTYGIASGGGGTGDVAWANGNVGTNNWIVTAGGDGSIWSESWFTADWATKIVEIAGNIAFPGTANRTISVGSGTSGYQLSVIAGDNGSGGTGGKILISGGDGNGALGGPAQVKGGLGSGLGGNVYIDGGNPNPGPGTGGSIFMDAGSGIGGTDGTIDIGTTDTA